MLSFLLVAASGLTAPMGARSAVMSRAGPSPAMMSRFNGEVWDIEAKTAIFNEWDPEKPRTYDNFNPFERNDDGAQCDTNGCFPGTSRGYTIPTRPDASWSIMQEEAKAMEVLKANPKYQIKGKPGNYSPNWQENLGAPP